MKTRIWIGWMAVWALMLILACLLIPAILVKPSEPEKSNNEMAFAVINEDRLQIPVYISEERRIETVPLEDYVRGVVAAEMPLEFELEALKAQAIAARTYMMNRLFRQDFSDVPVEGAWVTDTSIHQVYMNQSMLESMWDDPLASYYIGKLNRAVRETEGLIATYDDRPIQAAYFSTSNGYTENSEEVWSTKLPYLRSVHSHWEMELSPRYQQSVSLPYQEVLTELGVSAQSLFDKFPERAHQLQVLERTTGGRIKSLRVGDKILSGKEVRERLHLNSTHFEWDWDGGFITFTTYGYGHGVGLSQWGAQGMALDGKQASDIITYYYQGVRLKKI